MGFPGGSDRRDTHAMQETQVRSLDRGRLPGEGNGNPLQDSCLENPLDRAAWQRQSMGHKELDTTE